MLQQKKVWFSKPRVETFSDGVFAIIITILVLEIHVPVIQHHDSIGELWTALIKLFPKFISWIISFFMVCVIWVNHHRMFESIDHISHKIFWLNAWLLLWCAFIPFPTALVGDYLNNPLALTIFGLVLGLMGSAFVLMRLVILKERLLNEKYDKGLFKKSTKNTIVFGVMLYLLGAAVAWIVPLLSLLVYLITPFYFIFFNSSNHNKEIKTK
jgi:uncharacterized membrane protein